MTQKSNTNRGSNIYCEKLKEYSNKKKWPQPVYKILPRHPKDSRPLYGCKVKVSWYETYMRNVRFVFMGVMKLILKNFSHGIFFRKISRFEINIHTNLFYHYILIFHIYSLKFIL